MTRPSLCADSVSNPNTHAGICKKNENEPSMTIEEVGLESHFRSLDGERKSNNDK